MAKLRGYGASLNPQSWQALKFAKEFYCLVERNVLSEEEMKIWDAYGDRAHLVHNYAASLSQEDWRVKAWAIWVDVQKRRPELSERLEELREKDWRYKERHLKEKE